jgi:hypothetical protein
LLPAGSSRILQVAEISIKKYKIIHANSVIRDKIITFASKYLKKNKVMMKKILFSAMLFAFGAMSVSAQAVIKFDKLTHNFGKFSESSPVVTCEFTYTNVGDKPLIINQAVPSCGCTVPEYTKDPIAPGEKGTIKVTYNGTGKFPGHFKKSITVRTNGKVEMTRLYIEGEMTEKK